MTNSEMIQVILMGLLVVITGIYAWRTFAISKATEKQATEIREQRYSESLPLLVPDIAPTINDFGGHLGVNEVPYLALQAGMKVIWHNSGKGLAINSRFSLWAAALDSHPGKVLYFPPHESTVLKIGAHTHVIDFDAPAWGTQMYDKPLRYQPRLVAKYSDIYEREIETIQEFRIDEQNEKAFLGELYFTINGRRLGEEVTS